MRIIDLAKAGKTSCLLLIPILKDVTIINRRFQLIQLPAFRAGTRDNHEKALAKF